jgi:hypothetical protein
MLRNSKTLAGARSARVRKPPRHRVHPANREIVEMLGFVRQVTGRPHLEVMAVLLREATGDKGLKRQEAGGPVARPPETSPGLAQALFEPPSARVQSAPPRRKTNGEKSDHKN